MIREEDILVTGGDGMLASYFPRTRRMGRRELDVTDMDAVQRAVESLRPRAILHLAAVADLTRAEADPYEAFRVNAGGVLNVARVARDVGTQFVLVSTNAVFDARVDGPFDEDAKPTARTHYGRSKLTAEAITRSINPRSLIVRTSWLFGGGPDRDTRFVGKIMRQIRDGVHEIRATGDSVGSPTYARDLAQFILGAIERADSGIVHAVNKGEASRHQVASSILEESKGNSILHSVGSGEFGTLEAPGNLSLMSNRARLRPWQEALQEYLRDEWTEPRTSSV